MTEVFDAVGATALLVHELGATEARDPRVRHVETATMLALAAEIVVDDGTRIRAAFAAPEAAARLRDALVALHGQAAPVRIVAGPDGRLSHRLEVTAPDADLARATGLFDRYGRRIPGLPSSLLSGTGTAAAIWRGALLARGGVGRQRGVLQLRAVCPDQAAALTLVDAAHWLGVAVRDQETVTDHRVLVRDPDSIDTLLRTTGAPATADVVRGTPVC